MDDVLMFGIYDNQTLRLVPKKKSKYNKPGFKKQFRPV